MSKYICIRCNKDFKQKSNFTTHKNRTKLCLTIGEQDLIKKDMEDKEKIGLINEAKDLRNVISLQQKTIEQSLKIKSLEDEVKKLKEENEKLKSNKPKPKDMTPKEITKSYEEQLQLRRDANKKIVDEAPEGEYRNEQEKQGHLQWLNSLAQAELDSDSDDALQPPIITPPKPRPMRVKKKPVLSSSSDSD